MAGQKRPTKKTSEFSADRPIATSNADRLGRSAFARALATRIRAWNGQESLAISLCGEWGSGKTSLKNMVLESLNKGRRLKMDVLQFNPWEISGHASIAAVFFRELGLALNHHSATEPAAKAAADRLTLYSKAASFGGSTLKVLGKTLPILGVPGGPILESIGEAAGATSEVAAKGAEVHGANLQEPSLSEVKRLLAADMAKLKHPLLVVIDDIDRLTTDEIREVFQLVKANADFPNLIYLLMFDREIVAGALDTIAGGRGHEFLDKIIQVPFHVPQPSLKQVHKILFEGLDAHLAETGVGERWETQRWRHVWPDGLSLYFTNLRHVYRFLSSFSFQVSQMRNGKTFELNPLDLIVLETLRLFEPSLYEALAGWRGSLTRHRHFSAAINHDETRKQAESEISALLSMVSDSRRERLRGILSALFPVIFGHQHPDKLEMLRQLRVGHEDLFDRYFTMSLPSDDVAQADVDALRANFTNPSEFVLSCLSLKSRGLLESAFERLDAYKQAIPKSAFPQLVTSLIQAGDMLPQGEERDFLSFDALTHAYRLVYFGLRTIEDENERFEYLRAGIQESSGVRLSVRLLASEERRPDGSSRDFLISEEHWSELKPLVIKLIHEAAADGRLKTMNGLSFILWRWKEWEGKTAVEQWISSHLRSGSDALWVLKTFLSTMRTEGNKVTFTRYLRLDTLAQFCDIEDLTAQTHDFVMEKLPQDDMRALRAFRQALIWKAEGKPADYNGDTWRGQNPLTEDS